MPGHSAITLVLVIGLFPLVFGCQSDTDGIIHPPSDQRGARLMEGVRLAFGSGEYASALVLADSAIQYIDDYPPLHFYRGLILTELNRFDESAEALHKTIELDPNYHRARYQLGHIAFLQGRFTEAITHYQQELDLHRRISPKLDDGSEDSLAYSIVTLQIGRAKKLLGQPDAAREYYEAALESDPSNPETHSWIAEVYEQDGDFETALEYARQAVALEGDNVDYRYMLGQLLRRLGRASEAVVHLEFVVRRQPWNEGATFNLAQALMQLGHEEDARLFLDRVDVLQALQSEIARAKTAAYLQPKNVNRWVELARLSNRSGQFEEAANALNVALTLEPSNLGLHNDRAVVALEMGDVGGAIYRFQNILRRDSTFIDAWLNLGTAYARSGHVDAARNAWEAVAELDPDNEEATSYLGRLPDIR